jgi:uncharacterized protein (TIGR03382 family)
MTSANVNLLGLLPAIEIIAIQASSQSTCDGASGSASVASIKLGGVQLQVSSAPNTVIPLPLNGRIVINEQIPVAGADHGLTVNAVHIVVPPVLGLAGVDLALGTATSAIHNCRPDQDFLLGDVSTLDQGGGCQSTQSSGTLALVALAAMAVVVRRRRRRTPI